MAPSDGAVWQARRPGRAVLWLPPAAVVALNLLSFGLLAWAAAGGDLTLGSLAIYVQATLAASSFRAFDDANMILSHAAVAVPRALALEPRLAGASHAASRSVPDDAPREAIRFEGIEFRYNGLDRPVLAGLQLGIPAGRSLAIVGVNGAGKTTLVKLLCRLYEPTGGRICVDGVDLATVDPEEWRGRVTAIFQDFARYHLSVRENVAAGAPSLMGDMEKLRATAKKAGALELIESLPRGWETVLSREYDGGVDLSGGQWQKLALGRAMMREEPLVLLLDEPPASLDAEAEHALFERYAAAARRSATSAGTITLLVSHRFSTVRMADLIVVLEGGRIRETGSHAELMAREGLYAELYELQARTYR